MNPWGLIDYVLLAALALCVSVLCVGRASRRIHAVALAGAIFVAGVLGGSIRFHAAMRDALGLDERPWSAPRVRLAGDPGLVVRASTQRPVHVFPGTTDRPALERWRARVTEQVRSAVRVVKLLGPEQSVPFRVARTERVEDVTRRLIAFRGHDGAEIPAFVCMPVSGTRMPGVLFVPGHGAEGAASLVGLRPDARYKSGALAVARAGFVCVVPELRGFGMLGRPGRPEHRLVVHNALLAGSLYKAELLMDLAYARTLLADLPEVDPDRLAIVGASFGAEMAMLAAVLDSSFRVVVCSAWGGETGPVEGYGRREGLPAPWDAEPHGCHVIPGINRILLKEDWFRLVAPRPALVVRGTADLPGDVEPFRKAMRQLYAELGAEDAFRFEVVEGGHGFFVEPTVRFLRRWLR